MSIFWTHILYVIYLNIVSVLKSSTVKESHKTIDPGIKRNKCLQLCNLSGLRNLPSSPVTLLYSSIRKLWANVICFKRFGDILIKIVNKKRNLILWFNFKFSWSYSILQFLVSQATTKAYDGYLEFALKSQVIPGKTGVLRR